MISIFVDNKQIDVTDDIDLLITRSIADIREPEKRTSDWSKTVTLPGTKVNNTLFTYIFDVALDILGNGQFAPSFNPNKKADVVVLNDGLEQLRGFIRLIQINVLDKNLIEYECSLHGQTADLFTSISNSKLSDLDFGEYNHTLNRVNVVDSWASSIIKNGISQPFNLGEGYVYAQILDKFATTGTNASQWRVDDHIPCLYAKTIIDKIFDNVGYEYSTDSFFNSERFKRLIVPFNNYGLNSDESAALNRLFQAQVSGINTYAYNQTIQFNNDSTGGNFDNGGNYNVSTYKYTAPFSGDYDFYLTLNANYSTATPQPNDYVQCDFAIYKNGVFAGLTPLFRSTTSVNSWDFDATNYATVNCLSGDQIEIKLNQVYTSGNLPIASTFGTFTINLNTYFFNKVSTFTFAYNNTLEFANFFKGDYTQKDFIIGLVKMFNLYIEPNYDNPKKLRIVTRDEFYNGANLDWSKKLDYSQPINIIPMGDLDANPFTFSYAEGQDNHSKEYKSNTNLVYGQRTIRIDNDFVKEEKKINVIFASTLFVQDNSTQRYYSVNNGSREQLRILYYGGLQTTSQYKIYESNISGAVSYTQYPLTLHIDSPTNMQFDLNFGMSSYVLAGKGFNYSNQNLVNVYWYKTIIEITNKNSKLFNGYFRINPYDWNKIKFNDLYYFENQYWRLNKIIDYNPLQDGVYQCEFLLAKYYDGTSEVKKTLGSGIADYFGNQFPNGKPLGFTGTIYGGINIGTGQDLGSENVNVGDSTMSMGMRLNTNLGGVNNAIPDAFSMVNLLNCTNFIPNEQAKTYIENWKMLGAYLSGGSVVEIDNTNSPYTVLREDYLVVADTNHGDINMVLPNPSTNKGKTFVVKKIDANHKIYITAGDGSILIDDTTTHEMGNSKLCHHFISTGSKYYVIVP